MCIAAGVTLTLAALWHGIKFLYIRFVEWLISGAMD